MKGLVKRSQRKQGLLTTTGSKARIVKGVTEDSGLLLNERSVRERVEFLSNIISRMVSTSLTNFWNPTSFKTLLNPKAPSFAAKAVETRLGLPTAPPNVHVSSRVQRLAADVVGRHIRQGAHTQTIVDQLYVLEQGSVEWSAIGGTRVEKRNLQRWVRKNPQYSNYFQLKPQPPKLAQTIPLAAGDDQLAKLSMVEHQLVLRILLPTKPTPTKKDWEWVILFLQVEPQVLLEYAENKVFLTLPTLSVRKNKVYADLTLDRVKPPLVGNPKRVFGLDWGLTRLMSGAFVTKNGDNYTTCGRLIVFDASSWHYLDHQRRRDAEQKWAKMLRLQQLLENNPDPKLEQKRAQLESESKTINKKRAQSNQQLAKTLARWCVEHAIANQAGVISCENLASLEPTVGGKRLRTSLSQRLRGQLIQALQTACDKAGVKLVLVNPAQTSQKCYQCANQLVFQKASDNTNKGYRWAFCESCNAGLDRDHNASLNIAKRALCYNLGNVKHFKRLKRDRLSLAPIARSSLVHNPSARLDSNVRSRRRLHRAVTPPQPRARVSVLYVAHCSAEHMCSEHPLGVCSQHMDNYFSQLGSVRPQLA